MNISDQKYQVKPGEIVYQQPYKLSGVRFHSFIFESTTDHLTRICDNWFKGTMWKGAVKPITPLTVVTFANYEGAGSKVAPYNQYGTVPYTEVIVSFFVMRLRKFMGIWWAQSMCAFVPYIFADNILPVVQGREVYGMPKTIGDINFSNDPHKDQNFKLSATSLKNFSPTEQSANNELLSIEIANANTPSAKHFEPKDSNNFFKEVGDVLDLKSDDKIILPVIGLGVELIKFIKNRQVPFLSLKQFRNINNGSKASLKSAVEFPCQMTDFAGGGIHLDPYNMTTFQNDMFPIQKDFGFGPGPIQSKGAFWMDWSFNFLEGKKIR